MKYDLEERTARFGEDIIDFIRMIERNEINRPLSSQTVRSATSVGANYMEANQAASKKDFKNKIRICQKEANETKHWLRMIARANPAKKDLCEKLWSESHQLTLIFAKISQSCDIKNSEI
jgi:four helix bundle protein